MLWDWSAPLDDFFDNAFNRAAYDGTGEAVARDDCVHEGACGTGAISADIVTVPGAGHFLASDGVTSLPQVVAALMANRHFLQR